ncbi:MAG: hypothetical protein NTZ65_04345 [Candidatus Berkelbacteria bacterium]|nr:hypothetical protein [Candidatus Berkelbacteria bacterium]
MEQQKKPSQIILLSSVFALMVGVLLVIFVIVPKVQELKTVASNVEAKKQELEAGQNKVAATKKAIQTMSAAKRDLDLLGVAIPNQPDPEDALVQISAASGKAGLKLSSIAIAQSDSTKGSSLGLTFSTLGNFDSTLALFDNLEKGLRPIVIKDYAISNSENSGDLSATFNLTLPYIIDESKAKAAAAAQTATDQSATQTETTNGQ